MMETEKRHKETFLKAAEMLKKQYPGLLALGVGCCTICSSCSYPDAPCRYPGLLHPSIEGYGLQISELAEKASLQYYGGPNTVNFFGGLLFKDRP